MAATAHTVRFGLNDGATLRPHDPASAADDRRGLASARPLAMDLQLQARAARARVIVELAGRFASRRRRWLASLLLNLRRRRTNDVGRGQTIQC